MRKIFIDELILAAKKNKNIILVVNDLGYNVVEPFAKKFPKNDLMEICTNGNLYKYFLLLTIFFLGWALIKLT